MLSCQTTAFAHASSVSEVHQGHEVHHEVERDGGDHEAMWPTWSWARNRTVFFSKALSWNRTVSFRWNRTVFFLCGAGSWSRRLWSLIGNFLLYSSNICTAQGRFKLRCNEASGQGTRQKLKLHHEPRENRLRTSKCWSPNPNGKYFLTKTSYNCTQPPWMMQKPRLQVDPTMNSTKAVRLWQTDPVDFPRGHIAPNETIERTRWTTIHDLSAKIHRN